MGTDTGRSFDLSARMEQLEDRLAMSADPLGGLLGGPIEQHSIIEEPPPLDHHQVSTPDFWIDTSEQELLEDYLQEIDQALAGAHDQTGLTTVRTDFGFSGIGQTVAVIDSGIAYDHIALGGGFGSSYRVVGGWDFTDENDANPYDDGPSGSHGTHVSGIIGATGSTHTGVAPGVDLVGLRVFDDSGAGWFSWVENALQWVHTNRNNFENPITAVNLSLGVASWNSDTIPGWTTLEDEFAQLEADGIFIAVSAGNSFTTYNETGLSYPAASSYVVPVMSVDDDGSLSYFSQRHTRAIAAPGRTIVSTVPDYVGNNNGIADDYSSFSGTSMAAPYVAGASVIIREAMDFAGYTNITQDTIYNHMKATADSIFDSATSLWYSSLNMSSAINALMPADDFGSSAGAAFDLGTLSGDSTVSGVIGMLSDADYFTFTAGSTGTVTFTASNMTHELAAAWSGTGQVSGSSNETYTIDVAAGQTYTMGFSSAGGLGYYDLDVTSFTYTDWGSIAFSQLEGLSVAGETWYRIEATNNGYVTVEGLFDANGGAITLDLYSTNMQLIDSGNSAGGTSRVDSYATAGDEFFVRVLGTNSDVDFRLSNLVSITGTTVQVDGTAGDDVFGFTAGNTHTVTVNGVSYDFAASSITDVNFNGGVGNDTIVMTGTAGDETAELRAGDVSLSGSGFSARALGIEDVTVVSNGGIDWANFYDSFEDNTYTVTGSQASMTGSGFQNRAFNFSRTNGYATAGGYDTVNFYDTVGDDTFTARPEEDDAFMSTTGLFRYASGFERVNAYATAGGYDTVKFYDTSGDDTVTARPEENDAFMA
ncbi:MAG: S8 family serine peptidase, partial [Planctomycetes bacterium]|nr:S8 family serine peptidase [Planctomycetota bacterium]